jgi:hypothetical protein
MLVFIGRGLIKLFYTSVRRQLFIFYFLLRYASMHSYVKTMLLLVRLRILIIRFLRSCYLWIRHWLRVILPKRIIKVILIAILLVVLVHFRLVYLILWFMLILELLVLMSRIILMEIYTRRKRFVWLCRYRRNCIVLVSIRIYSLWIVSIRVYKAA